MSRLSLRVSFAVGLCLVALAASLAWAQSSPTPAPNPGAEQQNLLAVLKSDAPHDPKLRACQRLALIGTKQSVPTLAGLLDNERLAHPARIALEQIPDPAAVEALRSAVARLRGPLLAGVVTSLGVRRDPAAVPLLTPLLSNADPQVAGAAAGALGRIATPEAAQSLAAVLGTAQGPVREAVADGCLRCAEALAAAGNTSGALGLCDSVRKAPLPVRIRAAALRGAILAKSPAGRDLLAEAIQSPEPVLFAMALTLAREWPDPAVTPVLLESLAKVPPARQAALLTLLGDRRDPSARAAVVQAARSPDPGVRSAAVGALGTLGDASSVALLLEVAAGADAPLAAAAADSLALLAGPDIDAQLVRAMAESQGLARRVAVEAAGRRQIAAAVPELTRLADAPDADLRRAALLALGQTLPMPQLPMLVDRLIEAKTPEDTAAIQAGLKAACLRMADKQVCAAMLTGRLAKAAGLKKVAIYELLSTVGGPAALAALGAGALDPDETLQDAATRILGDWATADAADTLLEVAQKAPQERFRVRALRGYLRIVRQMDFADRQRVDLCKQAMGIAQRDDERKLVLEILGRIPHVKALSMAVFHMQTPSLKGPACAAAVAIAEKLPPSQLAQAAEPMRQVLQATKDANLIRRANEVLQRAEAQKPASAKP